MSLDEQNEADVSAVTFPDVSLGSLGSSFHSPLRAERKPSPRSATSISTAPSSVTLSTPSSSRPVLGLSQGAKADDTPVPLHHTQFLGDSEDTDGKDDPPTPVAPRAKRGLSMGASRNSVTNLTLRDQEKAIDLLKKENFSLKLKVHFLEERLNQLAPEHVEAAFKQNINLKIEVQSRGVELKKYKKLLVEMEKELQTAQKGVGGSKARERDLEEVLAERERELRELRRRRAIGPEDGALRELEARNAELEETRAALEDELQRMNAITEEKLDEIDRLKDELAQKGNQSMTSDGGETRRARLERKLAELEGENEELRVRNDDHVRLIEQHEDEKEALADEFERMKLTMEDLERRREAELLERSESRAQVFEEREEREAIEDNLNSVRDQLAATTIELQQREDELEVKCQEIDEMLADHRRQLQAVDDGWRGEVKEARAHVEELRDLIADRDAEFRELRALADELEETNRTAHENFETAMELRDNQLEQKEDEIEAANMEIEQLGKRIWELEDEVERLREDNERIKDEAVVDKEASQSIITALKEKLASSKTQLQEVTSLYEQYRQEILAHRKREEELGQHASDLAADLQAEQEKRERLEKELESLERQREDDARQHRRALEDKEADLRSTLDSVSRQTALVSERDADLAALQAALKKIELESRRAGESHTNDKFSLELELDRLKRDVARMEDELTRARVELGDREAKNRDREHQIEVLHSTNRDLSAEVATQTQARLNITEKLDSTQSSLRTAEVELASFRARVNDLEQRLSKDQRSLLSTEHQFRDQLTERNTLLLTIYQYMDKILGVDRSPKKGVVETKPFTNFTVFHDNLISKLKALSQIQLDFDKRSKEVEARLVQKFGEIKKQMDYRWKQIDNFEAKIKNASENKQSWRRRYMTKEGELEAIKATNTELSSQLSLVKGSPNLKESEIRALNARNANHERRLANAQNQLASAEERNALLVEKHQSAEQKWEARVKEYETRLKAADEKVKRERQGGKERIVELENHIKTLSKQVDIAKQRNTQLTEIVDNNNKLVSANR